MTTKQLSEIIYNIYDGGRPSATNVTLGKEDMAQLVFMESAYQLKMRFYQSRKDADDEKTDFIAGMLGTRVYDLTDADYRGKRSATYTEEVLRLPKNSDVTNVYMVGSDCKETVNGSITQVQPGEENFYMNDLDLRWYIFFVQKGKKIDTYNVPPCVKKIEVERVYTDNSMDVPLDIAFEVAMGILGFTLKVRGFVPTEDNAYDANRNQLRYQLEQQDKKGV